MALKRALFALVFLFIVLPPAPCAHANRRQEVLFPNTDHELRIYRITGREKGKTLMIIGGIQGDEPGGYLTADLYADLELKKGNLIVVPRANLFSILLNKRSPRGDMNRMFADRAPRCNEARVVEVLKNLIYESDCLLNLHEGSGFFSPRWESDMVNPRRYGQSIIVDAETYTIPDSGRVIRLGELARRVIDKVNRHITQSRYRFKFNNHRTLKKDTIHPEQRKSATFYALTHAHIPAFGIETSKSISDIEVKVRHHRLVVNTFLEEMGIVQETPAILLTPPVLDYLVVSVNRRTPIVLSNHSTLTLASGDELRISHAETNYPRGVYVDIVGVGNQNDTDRTFRITRSTRIIVRKDKWPCGWVRLKVVRDKEGPVPLAKQLVLSVNGKDTILDEGRTLRVIRGDVLVIKRVLSDRPELDVEIKANFKGFVPNTRVNLGDDRGFEVDTSDGLLVRFSADNSGIKYPVVAKYGDTETGRFWVKIDTPLLNYLVLKTEGEKLLVCPEGSHIELPAKELCRIVHFKANFPDGPLNFLVNGRSLGLGSRFAPGELAGPEGALVKVERHGQRVGQFFIKVRDDKERPAGKMSSL